MKILDGVNIKYHPSNKDAFLALKRNDEVILYDLATFAGELTDRAVNPGSDNDEYIRIAAILSN